MSWCCLRCSINKRCLNKIIITKKGTFRVVSNISYGKIVCLLETSDLDEKFGYL